MEAAYSLGSMLQLLLFGSAALDCTHSQQHSQRH